LNIDRSIVFIFEKFIPRTDSVNTLLEFFLLPLDFYLPFALGLGRNDRFSLGRGDRALVQLLFGDDLQVFNDGLFG
jgi:hypothetical protein